MSAQHPLKKSIEKKMKEERYVFSEKKNKRKFQIQYLLIFVVLMGLILSIIRLIDLLRGLNVI